MNIYWQMETKSHSFLTYVLGELSNEIHNPVVSPPPLQGVYHLLER